MKNNIAILILAHHNAEQLSLLINHLKPNFDIYVQIDKKSDLEINQLPKSQNLYYFKEIDVFWGHFTQILNMKFILERAYQKGYDMYCFISGDDFPIKSNEHIKTFFNSNKNNIYMYANPLPITSWGFNNGFDRLDRYWFMKIYSRKFVKIFARLTLVFQRILFIKNKRFPIKYYAGSNWLNLTHESVIYVFNFLKQNPNYLKKLRYSRATDEIWIQTILMNSPLKEKVVNDDLRYIDWTTGPDFPRILDYTDLEKIKDSKAIFARKILFNDSLSYSNILDIQKKEK